MKKTESQLIESFWFMGALTFVGGYLDAYTYVTRGGVFANNQTGNIAKLGIEVFRANWIGAVDALAPLIATILGAIFAEFIKTRKYGDKPTRWRQVILVLELLVLLAMGFVPRSVPHVAVNLTISFIASFQLASFRKFEGWVHNTTISTGNLRSLGQYIFEAFVNRDGAFTAKVARYGIIVFSFAVGATLGAMFCHFLDIRAIWICCGVLAILAAAHAASVNRQSEAA